MESVWIVRFLASDAVRWQEDKYAIQQRLNLIFALVFHSEYRG